MGSIALEAHLSTGFLAFTVALLSSLLLTVPIRALALRVGMVDHPGPRKVHLAPMPLLGGLAIYAGVILSTLISMDSPTRAQIFGILAGATLVICVGILDDRGLLHHQIKLFVGMPIAALILLASGIHAQVLSGFVPGPAGRLADEALTVLLVVGITAAFSILDHMDGLCAGIAAIASLFFAVFAILAGQILISTLAAAVLGAALGFLRWNFRPAKIFMGDGGAMLLGYLMATLALKLRVPQASPAGDWLIPFFILGVPIFDTALVSISRSRRGLLPFSSPGKDHAAHRLSNLGLGQGGAVLTLYGLAFVCGLFALLVRAWPSPLDYFFAAGVAAVLLGCIALLERVPFERQIKPSAVSASR